MTGSGGGRPRPRGRASGLTRAECKEVTVKTGDRPNLNNSHSPGRAFTVCSGCLASLFAAPLCIFRISNLRCPSPSASPSSRRPAHAFGELAAGSHRSPSSSFIAVPPSAPISPAPSAPCSFPVPLCRRRIYLFPVFFFVSVRGTRGTRWWGATCSRYRVTRGLDTWCVHARPSGCIGVETCFLTERCIRTVPPTCTRARGRPTRKFRAVRARTLPVQLGIDAGGGSTVR